MRNDLRNRCVTTVIPAYVLPVISSVSTLHVHHFVPLSCLHRRLISADIEICLLNGLMCLMFMISTELLSFRIIKLFTEFLPAIVCYKLLIRIHMTSIMNRMMPDYNSGSSTTFSRCVFGNFLVGCFLFIYLKLERRDLIL